MGPYEVFAVIGAVILCVVCYKAGYSRGQRGK